MINEYCNVSNAIINEYYVSNAIINGSNSMINEYHNNIMITVVSNIRTTWFWDQMDTTPLEMEAMIGLTGCHWMRDSLGN